MKDLPRHLSEEEYRTLVHEYLFYRHEWTPEQATRFFTHVDTRRYALKGQSHAH
jgi:hypothetical protein